MMYSGDELLPADDDAFGPFDEDDTMPCGCESGSCYCDDDGLTDAEADALTLGYTSNYFGEDF